MKKGLVSSALFRIIIFLGVIICLGGAYVVFFTNIINTSLDSLDPVSKVARRYKVDEMIVVDLANQLGVDPDKIDAFGNYYFPYNYYENQFGLFEERNGRPPRKFEVEGMMRGYLAKCNVAGPSSVAYIYYSQETHPGLFKKGIAMVFVLDFQVRPGEDENSSDLLFSHMQPIELWDASVNPPDNNFWEECINNYNSISSPK